jgi:hypothetical protein
MGVAGGGAWGLGADVGNMTNGLTPAELSRKIKHFTGANNNHVSCGTGRTKYPGNPDPS